MKKIIPLAVALTIVGVCCVVAGYFCQFYYSRYHDAVTGLLVTGLATLVLQPLLPGKAPDPIGVDWAALPGSFVGALAGYRVYQMISGASPRKATR